MLSMTSSCSCTTGDDDETVAPPPLLQPGQTVEGLDLPPPGSDLQSHGGEHRLRLVRRPLRGVGRVDHLLGRGPVAADMRHDRTEHRCLEAVLRPWTTERT
jgi:hypothetical protein